MVVSTKKAAVPKRTRKATDKIIVPPVVAVAPVAQVKPAAKARKPAAKAAKPVVEAPKAIEAIVETSEPIVAQMEEVIEAVASPAIESDFVPEVATPSPVTERILEMATVKTPTEGFEKGQAMLGDATARFKTAFEKSSKMSEDMVDFAKGNVEAVVASARVAAKAGESLGQDAADYSKKQFESATALFKSFANIKSPTDLFQLQSDFAKASFDSAVAEASRVSESMMKIAGEIAQPLSSRYAVAAEKLKANVL